MVRTHEGFSFKDSCLPFDLADSPGHFFKGRRAGGQTDGHPGAGRVQDADRFVRQLSCRQIAMRQPHRFHEGFIGNHDVMMLFNKRPNGPHHDHGRLLIRFLDLDHLKAPGQGGILFKVFLVFRPGRGRDGAKFAAGQGRFEQIGGVPGTGRAPSADHGMGLVDKKDDGDWRGFDLVDHGF